MFHGPAGGKVVRTYTIGGTRIRICDEFCRERTAAEIADLLVRIARQAARQLSAAPAAGKQ